jgi:hypothetical protein
MALIQVFVVDPNDPSPVAATALQRARAAAGRFGPRVEVRVVSLDEESAVQRGISMEPAILVGELLVAVGQAPPAGHVVRAIEAALAKEGSVDG